MSEHPKCPICNERYSTAIHQCAGSASLSNLPASAPRERPEERGVLDDIEFKEWYARLQRSPMVGDVLPSPENLDARAHGLLLAAYYDRGPLLAALSPSGAQPGLSVRQMQEVNAARSARWMAGSPGWTILEIAGELAGEVGELANVCKKLRRSEMGVPGNKVSDAELLEQARGEAADVFIVLMLTASKLGIDLQDATCATFNRKSEQMGFPERFVASPSPLAAEGEAEGEVRRAVDDYVMATASNGSFSDAEFVERERRLQALVGGAITAPARLAGEGK